MTFIEITGMGNRRYSAKLINSNANELLRSKPICITLGMEVTGMFNNILLPKKKNKKQRGHVSFHLTFKLKSSCPLLSSWFLYLFATYWRFPHSIHERPGNLFRWIFKIKAPHSFLLPLRSCLLGTWFFVVFVQCPQWLQIVKTVNCKRLKYTIVLNKKPSQHTDLKRQRLNILLPHRHICIRG